MYVRIHIYIYIHTHIQTHMYTFMGKLATVNLGEGKQGKVGYSDLTPRRATFCYVCTARALHTL